MSNNFWNYQQQNGNQPSENNGVPPPGNSGAPRSGSLLRGYRQQQQQQGIQQYSPNQPSPFQGQPPQQQGWPPQGPQNWVANAMQTVRRWSGRVAAVPGRVDQNPLVLYRPAPKTRLPAPVHPKSKPWKRSRTLRVSMLMRRRRVRWKQNGPSQRKIAVGIIIGICLLIVVTLSAGGGSAYAYYQQQVPRLQGLANQQVSQTSRIYDRNGTLLYQAYDDSLTGGRRTPVAYKDIPKVMQDAMIASEDSTFWDNSGVNPVRIFSAASQRNGGASTLTQQLIKNLTHDDQPTIDRKISEAALAIGLTQQYPKWKILEMYFNVAPFGSKELGVEAAVEDYFGLKPRCDANFNCVPAIYYLAYPDNNPNSKPDPVLALARASLLAGLPQNPVEYDPSLDQLQPGNKDRALSRQQYVLGEMLRLGMQVDGLGPITPDIVAQAEALTAKMTFHLYQATMRAPHFVFWVIDQLSNALGNGDPQAGYHAFLTGGFNIRTTIDASLEDYVERAVKRHLTQPEYQKFTGGYGPLNKVNHVDDAAVVVMNAKTGEVLAMNGSTDWNSKNPAVSGNVDAALAPRQPGSSFKPVVYAAAFNQGWYPGMIVPDQKTFFPTGGPQTDPMHNSYHPTDYGGGYHNTASTIRLALANSFNVPAVKTVKFVGLDNVVKLAHNMGLTAVDDFFAKCRKKNPNDTLDQCAGPSVGLGTIEVPLLQMVGAYQVFANQGVRIPPQGVLDVWDNYGHHLYHFDPAHPHGLRVLSAQVSYLMTNVLSDEYARRLEFWPDHDLSMWDWDAVDGRNHEVAAKTGTTDNFRDNWAIGYTPDVVVGVWAGNADNTPFQGNVVGITGAAPIWHSVVERVSGACNIDGAGIPCGSYKSPFKQLQFIVPPGVHQVCVSKVNGLKGTGSCDWMIDGEEPMQTGLPAKDNTGTGIPPTPTQ